MSPEEVRERILLGARERQQAVTAWAVERADHIDEIERRPEGSETCPAETGKES
jgi:hypothetical protein